MTRQQAIAKLQKLYGKCGYYRVAERQSSPEDRAAALAALRAHRTRVAEIDAEIEERLAALDWLQALRAERRALRDQIDRAQGEASRYRFTIGADRGLFAEVTGQGDTWEEAFAKAAAKKGEQ